MKSLTEKYLLGSAFLRSPDEPGAPASGGGSDGGTTSPGEISPTSTESGASTPNDDFSGFDSVEDLDTLGAGTDPSPEPVVPPTTPPVTPAPAAPAAPEKPTAPAVPAPTPQNEPAAAAPPQSEVEGLLQSLSQNTAPLQEWLAANAYALTKEEADAFELDAVGQVPKLMAKVAVAGMKSTMTMINQLVPKLIASEVAKLNGTQAKSKEALNEFYTTHTDLNEKDHGALVTKWANVFRAANPKASRQEAIKFVGNAIRTELGIAPGAAPAQRAVPFAPARPGARMPTTQVNVDEVPFAGLGGSFDE